MKKEINKRTISRIRTEVLIALSLMFLLIFVSLTFALSEQDITKRYESIDKRAVISDSGGKIIIDAELETPQTVKVIDQGEGILQRVAEIKINQIDKATLESLNKGKLINGFELIDLRTNKEITREIILKYRTISGYYNVSEWTTECGTPFSNSNGTINLNCTSQQTNHQNEIYEWKDLSDLSEISKDSVIGLYTDVQKEDNVEWIPTTINNIKIDEWAQWEESLNNNLSYYWNLSSIGDIHGGYNLSTVSSPSFQTNAAFIAVSGNISGGKYWRVSQTDVMNMRLFTHSTVNIWYRPSLTDPDDCFIWFDGDVGGDNAGICINSDTIRWRNTFSNGNVDGPAGSASVGDWHMATLKRNSTGMYGYSDGNLDQQSFSPYWKGDGGFFNIGQVAAFVGLVDEASVWNRSLSDSEIVHLYNNGNGITYAIPGDTQEPKVNLLSPSNIATTNENKTFFNAHFTDNVNVSNASLYIYNSTNSLIGTNFTILGNSSIQTNISYTLNYTGIFHWNFLAIDTSNNQAFNHTNYTLTFSAPSNVSTNVTYDTNLTYDNNGNLISGFDKNYTYNSFNELTQIANATTGELIAEYKYDHNGERIKSVEYDYTTGNNKTTYYISDNFIQTRYTNGTILNETYIYANGKLLAKQDNNNQKTYYHPDHLGSTTLATNQSGDITEEEFYLPYGEIYDGNENSRHLYTSKEKDKSTNLYYYGARYYNSLSRQFIQPDSLIADIYNPQNLNRYSYVLNNPYKYTDSSGNYVETVLDIGFIAYDISQIIQDPHNSENYIALGLDVAGAALPFATGLGAGFKVAKNADKVSDFADVAKVGEKVAQETADKLGVATNRFQGIAKHTEATTSIRESGIKNIFTEISIKGGKTVPYGTKGSTRVDVISSTQDLSRTGITINPSATKSCCDFKFGKSGLSSEQSSRIATETGKTPKEIRPNILQKVKSFFGGK